ncbi:MAG: hypothetical protein J6X24_02540 [Firmicutes bacterium]|nr:hypothetical protein [Bacillota bacterium]
MKKDQTYRIICEEWNEEGVTCPCYGLVCEDLQIHYVSPDRELVERIADALNDGQTDPERALEVVESMLP